MRFFEFKLPEKDSPFFKKIFSELSSLIDLAQKLPEEDPIRKQVSDYIDSLKNKAGVTESDAVLNAERDLLVAMAKAIGGPEATKVLLDIDDLKKKILKQLTKYGEVQQAQGKEKIQSENKEKLNQAKKLAEKVGKDDKWARKLHNILSMYENDNLHKKFLTLCLNNRGLKDNYANGTSLQKLNLKNIINPELLELFSNQTIYTELAKLPLTEGTGMGSGVGPGESIFACLTPNTKKAVKSDLEIDGKIWEVKGGSSQDSTGWLDATSAKATDIKAAFLDGIKRLTKNPEKEITRSDGSIVPVKALYNAADFREGRFLNLKTIMGLLRPEERYITIDKMYEQIAPTVKRDSKLSKIYNQSVEDTVKLIINAKDVGSIKPIEKMQAKLSMLEYAIGSFKAENFLIYNYVTQDMVVVQGIEGIIQSIDGPSSMFVFKPITMIGTGAAKGSPGLQVEIKAKRLSKKVFN